MLRYQQQQHIRLTGSALDHYRKRERLVLKLDKVKNPAKKANTPTKRQNRSKLQRSGRSILTQRQYRKDFTVVNQRCLTERQERQKIHKLSSMRKKLIKSQKPKSYQLVHTIPLTNATTIETLKEKYLQQSQQLDRLKQMQSQFHDFKMGNQAAYIYQNVGSSNGMRFKLQLPVSQVESSKKQTVSKQLQQKIEKLIQGKPSQKIKLSDIDEYKMMVTPRATNYLTQTQKKRSWLKKNAQFIRGKDYQDYKYPIKHIRSRHQQKVTSQISKGLKNQPQIEESIFEIEKQQNQFQWTLRPNKKFYLQKQKRKKIHMKRPAAKKSQESQISNFQSSQGSESSFQEQNKNMDIVSDSGFKPYYQNADANFKPKQKSQQKTVHFDKKNIITSKGFFINDETKKICRKRNLINILTSPPQYTSNPNLNKNNKDALDYKMHKISHNFHNEIEKYDNVREKHQKLEEEKLKKEFEREERRRQHSEQSLEHLDGWQELRIKKMRNKSLAEKDESTIFMDSEIQFHGQKNQEESQYQALTQFLKLSIKSMKMLEKQGVDIKKYEQYWIKERHFQRKIQFLKAKQLVYENKVFVLQEQIKDIFPLLKNITELVKNRIFLAFGIDPKNPFGKIYWKKFMQIREIILTCQADIKVVVAFVVKFFQLDDEFVDKIKFLRILKILYSNSLNINYNALVEKYEQLEIINKDHDFIDMVAFKKAYNGFHLDIYNLLDLIVGNF